jgi:hypothetical protein
MPRPAQVLATIASLLFHVLGAAAGITRYQR